jgi:hypothetical protein
MQVTKEKEPLLFTQPYNPKKAEVGKLYELRIIEMKQDASFQCFSMPAFFVFDTQGKLVNKTWVPHARNYCMVLKQDHAYTTILVGEDIIRVTEHEDSFEIQLIPLNE